MDTYRIHREIQVTILILLIYILKRFPSDKRISTAEYITMQVVTYLQKENFRITRMKKYLLVDNGS